MSRDEDFNYCTISHDFILKYVCVMYVKYVIFVVLLSCIK